MTIGHLYGALAASLVLLALAIAKYASSSREASVLRAENTRLWSLIQSMRAVTIDPPRPEPVVYVRGEKREAVVEIEQEAPRLTRFEDPVGTLPERAKVEGE